MRSEYCEALVLGTMDYREADRIVTLFTLKHGKVRGIARGAKRSVRRFGGALELFARLRAEILLKEGLAGIQSADIVTIYPRIRDDLTKIGLAGYVCELTDAFLPEGAANPRLFRLICSYLEHLDYHPVSFSDRRFFELNFLNVLGFRPSLDRCATCSKEMNEGAWLRISMAASGLLCGTCGEGGYPLSQETVLLLRRTLQTGRFGSVSFPPPALKEAGNFLDRAMEAHLNRPLKALSFLREIGR